MSNLINPESLAQEFGESVDRRKVIEWVRRYHWPHVKVGRTIAFTPAQVEQIIAIHSVDGTQDFNPDRMPGQTALSARRAS